MIASGPSGNDMRCGTQFYKRQRRTPHGFAMHYYTGGRDPSTNFTVEHMDEQFAVRSREAVIGPAVAPR